MKSFKSISVILIGLLLAICSESLHGENRGGELFPSSLTFLPGENSHEIQFFPMPSGYFSLNLPFNTSDLFLNGGEAGKLLLSDELSQKAVKSNLFSMETGIRYFDYTFYKNSKWHRFYVEDQLLTTGKLDNNLLSLILHGNRSILNQPLHVNFGLAFQHLSSFNYSRAIHLMNNMDLVFTSKLYFGKGYFNLKASPSLLISNNFQSVEIEVQGKGRVSLPLKLANYTGDGKADYSLFGYMTELRNPGAGVDLAWRMKLSDRSVVYAGINDLGVVLWNRNTTSFTTDVAYNWSGVDISGRFDLGQLGDFKESSDFKNFQDAFLNQLVVPHENSFLTLAPVHAYGRLEYAWKKELLLSGSVHFRRFFPIFQPEIGGTVSFTGWKHVAVQMGYFWRRNSFFNFPARLAFNFKSVAVYLESDDIVGALLPGVGKSFGGGVHCVYRFDPTVPQKSKKLYKGLPFFQPLK